MQTISFWDPCKSSLNPHEGHLKCVRWLGCEFFVYMLYAATVMSWMDIYI